MNAIQQLNTPKMTEVINKKLPFMVYNVAVPDR